MTALPQLLSLTVLAGQPEAEGPVRAPAVGDLSVQGTDRGALELGLGSTALAVSVALIVHGAFQVVEGQRKAELCSGFERPASCTFDGPGLRYASAGLSFALAVPVAVGGALWLRKGVRIHRDFRAYHQARLGLWTAPGPRGAPAGGGVRLSMRF